MFSNILKENKFFDFTKKNCDVDTLFVKKFDTLKVDIKRDSPYHESIIFFGLNHGFKLINV